MTTMWLIFCSPLVWAKDTVVGPTRTAAASARLAAAARVRMRAIVARRGSEWNVNSVEGRDAQAHRATNYLLLQREGGISTDRSLSEMVGGSTSTGDCGQRVYGSGLAEGEFGGHVLEQRGQV